MSYSEKDQLIQERIASARAIIAHVEDRLDMLDIRLDNILQQTQKLIVRAVDVCSVDES